MHSLADRPGRAAAVRGTVGTWPHFVVEDLVACAYFPRIGAKRPEYVLFAENDRGDMVATAHSMPFALAAEGRGQLPVRGWDQMLHWAPPAPPYSRTPARLAPPQQLPRSQTPPDPLRLQRYGRRLQGPAKQASLLRP